MGNVHVILGASMAALLMWLATPAQATDQAGAASPGELGTRYSQALARKDVNAYALLVCWDRVLPRERGSLESGFTQEAANTTTDFRFLTLEQMDQEVRKTGGTVTRTPVKREGVTLDFNLPVVGYLAYRSKSQDGKMQGTGAVPVGVKGGRYFITPRAPVQ